MPRYFFDTANGDNDCDEEGVEISDHETARAQAIRYLGALIADKPDLILADRPFSVAVRTQMGEITARIEAHDRGAG